MTTLLQQAMPAPTTPEKRAQILARLRLNEPKAKIARDLGIDRGVVVRLAKQHGTDDVATDIDEQAAAIERQATSRFVEEATDTMRRIGGKALRCLEDSVTPPSKIDGEDVEERIVLANSSIAQQNARWIAERFVSSADAKEQTKAAVAGADKYANILGQITATTDEVQERMTAVEAAQEDVVERRRPHIVNLPDSASA